MAQTASGLWKDLLTRSGVLREYRFIITDPRTGARKICQKADEMTEGEISHSVVSSLFDQFGVGNAVSARLDLTILTDEIPRGAKIERQIRLYDQDTGEASEWLPKGTFWPNRRTEEDGLWTVEAWDAIRKAEVPWTPDPRQSFPLSARTAVDIFASMLGVDVDPRTYTAMSGADHALGYPTSDPDNKEGAPITVRQELRAIAAAYGGNFIMSDAGELRLVPLLEWQADGAVRHDIGLDLVSDADGKTLPAVSRVTFSVDSEHVYSAGNDNGLELTASVVGLYAGAETPPDAGAETYCGAADAVTAVRDYLRGYEYQMFSAEAAGLDPAAELGDGVRVGGEDSGVTSTEITSFLAQINDDGSGYPDIAAPGEAEAPDEMPAAGPMSQAVAYQIAKTYSAVATTAESVTIGIYRTINEGSTAEEAPLAEFFLGINNIRTSLYGDGDEYDGLVSIVDQLPGSITSTIYRTINEGSTAEEAPLAEFFLGINNIRLQLWGYDEDGNIQDLDGDHQPITSLTSLFNMTPSDIVAQVSGDSWISNFKVGIEGLETNVSDLREADTALSTRITQNATDITAEATRRETGDGELSARITANASAITAEVSARSDGDDNTLREARSLIQLLSDSIVFSVTESVGLDGDRHATFTLTVDGISHGLGQILLDGNVNISGTLSAESLYTVLGNVADLIVNQLMTTDRIRKYLAGDTSDDHYQHIHGETHDYISGAYAGGEEQATDPSGNLLYWEDDPRAGGADHSLGPDGYPHRANGTRIYMTTSVTDWPVMQYTYNDETKLSIRFDTETTEDGRTIYTPIIKFGAGNAGGTNQGRLEKRTDGLWIMFQPNDDAETGDPRDEIGIHMTLDGYLDLYGQRRVTSLDFSGWTGEGTGSYTETVQGEAAPRSNTVTFDEEGRPVKITDSDGFEMTIAW